MAMFRRVWTIRAATLDGPCPEIGPRSEAFTVGNLVQVADWEDEFNCGGVGHADFRILVDPDWRDSHEWGDRDDVVDLAFRTLFDLALGRPLPEGLYCLPYEWVRDICRLANGMLRWLNGMGRPEVRRRIRESYWCASVAFALETAVGFLAGPSTMTEEKMANEEVDCFPLPYPLFGCGMYGRMDE